MTPGSKGIDHYKQHVLPQILVQLKRQNAFPDWDGEWVLLNDHPERKILQTIEQICTHMNIKVPYVLILDSHDSESATHIGDTVVIAKGFLNQPCGVQIGTIFHELGHKKSTRREVLKTFGGFFVGGGVGYAIMKNQFRDHIIAQVSAICAGLTGGIVGAAAAYRSNEYAADAFMTKAVGKEAAKKTLQYYLYDLDEAYDALLQDKTIIQKLAAQMRELFSAHPSLRRRIQRIDKKGQGSSNEVER